MYNKETFFQAFVHFVPQPRRMTLKLYQVPESPGRFVKKKYWWAWCLEFLFLKVWGRVWELLFLTSSQSMLLLLVWKHTLRNAGLKHFFTVPILWLTPTHPLDLGFDFITFRKSFFFFKCFIF